MTNIFYTEMVSEHWEELIKEPKRKKKPLKVGNFVKIESIGGLYSAYSDMADIMNLKNWQKNKKPDKKLIYRIIDTEKHERTFETVYAVESPDGKQYLIGGESLKLEDKSPFLLTDEDFDI